MGDTIYVITDPDLYMPFQSSSSGELEETVICVFVLCSVVIAGPRTLFCESGCSREHPTEAFTLEPAAIVLALTTPALRTSADL